MGPDDDDVMAGQDVPSAAEHDRCSTVNEILPKWLRGSVGGWVGCVDGWVWDAWVGGGGWVGGGLELKSVLLAVLLRAKAWCEGAVTPPTRAHAPMRAHMHARAHAHTHRLV